MNKWSALFLFFTTALCFSQVPKTLDSVKVYLKTKPKDTLYVQALNEYAFQLIQSGAETAAVREQIDAMHKLSQKLNYKTGYYKVVNMKGVLEYSHQNSQKAMGYFLRSMELIKKFKLQKKLYQTALNNVGIIYTQMGDREHATKIAMELLHYQEKYNLKPYRTFPYDQLGENLKLYKKYDEALVYYNKMLDIETGIDNDSGIAIAENKIGNVYDDMRDFAKAEKHYNHGLECARKANYKLLQTDLLTNLARIYKKTGRIEKAKSYLLECLTICDELELTTPLKIIYQNLGDVHEKEKDYVQAEKYYLKSLEISRTTTDPEGKYTINQTLSDLKETTGDYKAALAYRVAADTFKDSVFKLETAEKTEELLRKYESEKKEQLIRVKNLEISAYDKQRWYLFGGIGLMAIIGGLLFFQGWNRKRTNRKLTLLNSELDTANQTKARLFSIIGHDLRTPVSQIYQFLELQKNDPELFSGDDLKRHNQRIAASAGNLLDTMEDLLSWSKSQMDAFSIRSTRFALADVTKEITALIDQKSQINVTVAPDLMVSTDRNLFTVILRNLLQNALKASKEQQQVLLTAKKIAEVVKIEIRNSGTMPKEAQSALIEGSEINSGKSGLGLSLVHDFCRRLEIGVQVVAENDITMVRLYLPQIR
ncbi:tetratricopeptide repeat protein [Flavobacterium silvaticum]|uniref:histidine kinase n=1 Tax=Flavobacterium silvaticum TaxID=1852020 RepID=A0A972FNI6_9FLAO|nr:tetratricopeptide repeat protein [Flavobacterium silvaticum]NMH28510.1 sensor histidine kinase [Flavobacterium silvaticum]